MKRCNHVWCKTPKSPVLGGKEWKYSGCCWDFKAKEAKPKDYEGTFGSRIKPDSYFTDFGKAWKLMNQIYDFSLADTKFWKGSVSEDGWVVLPAPKRETIRQKVKRWLK